MTSTTVTGHASRSELVTDDERFRLLVEGVRDYASLMLDPAGMLVSWNDGAERITGYGAAEALGRGFLPLHARSPRGRPPATRVEDRDARGTLRGGGLAYARTARASGPT